MAARTFVKVVKAGQAVSEQAGNKTGDAPFRGEADTCGRCKGQLSRIKEFEKSV